MVTVPEATSYLLLSDRIVLDNLRQDISFDTEKSSQSCRDDAAIQRLRNLNNPRHSDYEPSILSMFDERDVSRWIDAYVLRPYYNIAKTVVRHPTDVVFLTHIIWNLAINVPSAIFLFLHFNWLHGIAHALHAVWCAGPMTLLLHNHIHNNGVLVRSGIWGWFDKVFPYIVEPLIGHTWDTYYYHHVRHHHVESNGPDDLSSTIRYQRDDPLHFLHYLGRFLFLIWLDLPLYFIRKRQSILALRVALSELSNYSFLYATYRLNVRAWACVFIFPLIFMRIALMVGNWGQHALVDEIEPEDDLRSSVTLIDVTSNRLCFNDGYHTSHHMNPRRHWRDQPSHFVQNKEFFARGKALVFYEIDFFTITIRLLLKDYSYLARILFRSASRRK